MLDTVLSAIRAARPTLSPLPSAIVEAICTAEGSIGRVEQVAKAFGLRNRFKLKRVLQRERLPSLPRMAKWATVVAWVRAAERDGTSLCWIAFHTGRHPAACYRLVKEVTGLCWTDVRARGSAWVEREFVRQLSPHPRKPTRSQ